MRPTGLESIRAAQAALAELIVPELSSPFAQDAAGTLQMLLESIAGEWDTAAENLRSDNDTLRELLSESRQVIETSESRNEPLAALVTEIEGNLRQEENASLTLTSLTSRNHALRATLERALVAAEDVSGDPAYKELDSVRRKIYGHLRDVATRGWSFWDVSSFRSRMTALRAIQEDDERSTRAIE